MANRVTLGDVAKAAGVSTATASLSLNGKPGARIPEPTILKVKEAASQLGYRPNTAARALKTGKTGVLGFISDEVTITRFASPMISGILEYADHQGMSVMMTETAHDEKQFSNAVRNFESRNVDGLIIGLMASRRITFPLPKPPSVICNGISDELPSILPDDYSAGYEAIAYLHKNGHSQIGLIGRYPTGKSKLASESIQNRMRGIDDAARHLGVQLIAEHQGMEWEPELGYRGALEILNHRIPSAILTANDRIAFGTYQALQERRLSIPLDVSVLSFDDEDLASLLRPRLTTFKLPYWEMGKKAVQLITQRTSGTEKSTSPLKIPLKVVERESVTTSD